ILGTCVSLTRCILPPGKCHERTMRIRLMRIFVAMIATSIRAVAANHVDRSGPFQHDQRGNMGGRTMVMKKDVAQKGIVEMMALLNEVSKQHPDFVRKAA